MIKAQNLFPLALLFTVVAAMAAAQATAPQAATSAVEIGTR